MEFDTILDKIEYELNQEDINLTDGFYSEDDDKDGSSSSDSVSLFKSAENNDEDT